MNKKASVQDVGIAMIFFFTAVVLFLVATYGFNTVVAKIHLTPGVNSSAVTIAAFDDANELTKRYDYVSVAILFGFILAIIITGWLVGGHPIFAWIYFIVLMILVTASAVISYVWGKIAANATLSGTVSTHFPIANHILNNFPVYISVIGFLGLLVMFAKPQQEING